MRGYKFFDQEFCSVLEYAVSNFLKKSKQGGEAGVWCDGVLHDESLVAKELLEKGFIETTAWIGSDGQGEYEMLVEFGEKSIENIKRGKELTDCIPEDLISKIRLDSEKGNIIVQLL